MAVEKDEDFVSTMIRRMQEIGYEGSRDEDRVRYFGQREEWGCHGMV